MYLTSFHLNSNLTLPFSNKSHLHLWFIFSAVCVISVGNIPYEATEEKLKDIFSEVGPVLSFK